VNLAEEATEALDRLEQQGERVAEAQLSEAREILEAAEFDDPEVKQALQELVDEIDDETAFGNELAVCLTGGAANA
jgi:predicted ATPase